MRGEDHIAENKKIEIVNKLNNYATDELVGGLTEIQEEDQVPQADPEREADFGKAY